MRRSSFVDASGFPFSRAACGLDGALGALGAARRADSRSQVHQRLIELPSGTGSRREESCGEVPRRLVGDAAALPRNRSAPAASPSESTPENSPDIRVHGGHAPLVGEAGDRSGSVTAHAGKGGERFGSTRDSPVQVVHHDAGQTMEVLRTAVVPQAVPRLPHPPGPRTGERSDGGESVDESPVVPVDPRHLGLLQHELRHEDVIRVPRASPRQVSTVGSKPLEQTTLEGEGVFGETWGHWGGRYGGRVAGRQGGRVTEPSSAALPLCPPVAVSWGDGVAP